MPSIEPYRNANGELTSYRITVSTGYDYQKKAIRHRIIWKPPHPGMSEKQMKKAAIAAAYKFEELIKGGYMIDNNWTFADYAQYALELKGRTGIRPSTLERYFAILPRINQAIGHIKLTQIRPQHLNEFYKHLAENERKQTSVSVTAKETLLPTITERGLSKSALAKRAGVAASTITVATQGESIKLSSAKAIAQALQCEWADLFSVNQDASPLSNKTILEHHRLISSILALAEKEMLITYNPAAKATPPKANKTTPHYFQPEQMREIIETLDKEAPLRWKAITYLLIDTGCRRGEIMGLKWEKVDLETGLVVIDCALLYSSANGIYEGPTKTGVVRAMKLAPQCLAVLRQWHQKYCALQEAAGEHWVSTPYVFVRDNGSCMHPDSITDWLNKFSQQHNLPHIHPHAFRHTAASTMIANGVDLVTAARELGHSSPITTATIYAHEIAIARAKAADARSGVFSSQKCSLK